MVPVFLLTDGYIANGSEPWKFPTTADLPTIKAAYSKPEDKKDGKFLPYERDEKLSRPWAIPGTPGLEHRIGGLEKQNGTGNISYDPANHEFMIHLRAEKIDRIADYIPDQALDNGPEKGDLLILGWGGTYGALKTATRDLLAEGYSVAHAHLRHLNPMPKNLGNMLKNYKQVLIPELNSGQLIKIIRDKYFIDAKGLNKVQGLPFTTIEVKNKVKELISISLNPSTFRGSLEEGFVMMAKGDSAIFLVNADSLFAKTFRQPLPTFIKPGSKVTFTIKMIDITTRAELEAKAKAEAEIIKAQENEVISKFCNRQKFCERCQWYLYRNPQGKSFGLYAAKG